MSPLILALPHSGDFAAKLADALDAELGELTLRQFPDGETYVRVHSDCAGRQVVIVASLEQPDAKILPMVFLADTLRELDAARVGLVAPYLAYMRQDRRFEPGEGVTSRYFGALMSRHIDWLVTVDPHLHRYDSLDEVYAIPSRVVHAAPRLAAWIREQVDKPVLVGPDAESEQWVSAVADGADAPFIVLEKTRRGDRDVQVSVPQVDRFADHTPVLVDDIISTGHTMIETVGHLLEAGMSRPVCVGVHGIFAQDAYQELLEAGAKRVVTTDTIAHASNAVDVSGPVVEAVRQLLESDDQK